jgi:hypothetical protein
MKRDMDNTIWLIFILIALAAILYVFGGTHVFGQAPTTVIAPNGSITYVYPSPVPGGPITVIPPSGQPTFVYPGVTPSAPITILPPSGQPSFVYPGTR